LLKLFLLPQHQLHGLTAQRISKVKKELTEALPTAEEGRSIADGTKIVFHETTTEAIVKRVLTERKDLADRTREAVMADLQEMKEATVKEMKTIEDMANVVTAIVTILEAVTTPILQGEVETTALILSIRENLEAATAEERVMITLMDPEETTEEKGGKATQKAAENIPERENQRSYQPLHPSLFSWAILTSTPPKTTFETSFRTLKLRK